MRKLLNVFFRWGILGATLLFLLQTLQQHWQEVLKLHLQAQSWLFVGAALVFAIANQLWTGVLWSWILATLKQPVPRRWALVVFLKNAPARYLPGNVWHLYGRVRAAQSKGVKLELATLSVALEPLCVIAAALGLALMGDSYPALKWAALLAILLAIHPRVLNFLWQGWQQFRGQRAEDVCIPHYPIRIVLGSIVFMGLRGLTFVMSVFVFTPVEWETWRPMVGGFGFAWLISLVVPSPGGLGVFESSAVNMLHDLINEGTLLGVVVIYRLVMILAELVGASFAHLLQEGTAPLINSLPVPAGQLSPGLQPPLKTKLNPSLRRYS